MKLSKQRRVKALKNAKELIELTTAYEIGQIEIIEVDKECFMICATDMDNMFSNFEVLSFLNALPIVITSSIVTNNSKKPGKPFIRVYV